MTTSATEHRDSGRQVGSGATSKLTVDLTGERRPELADRLSRARRRSTVARMTGSGLGDGWAAASAWSSVVDVDRLAVALVPLGRRVALGGDALGLARLVEQAAALGETAVASARRSRAADRVSRSRSSWARASSPCSSAAVDCVDRLLGDLEPAGVALAPGGQVVERLVELLARPARPAVGAADRRLEPVAQRTLVARQVAQLEMVDRGRRAEEALGRDPGEFGHDLVGQLRVGDRLALVVEPDGPLAAGERLLEHADLLAVLLVLLEFDGDDRAGLGRRAPRPERLELARGAGRPSGQGEFERPLDRRLAGLVRAADDGHAGREVDVELAVAPEVAPADASGPSQGDLVAGQEEPTEAQGVAVFGGLGGRPGAPRARRCAPRGRG